MKDGEGDPGGDLGATAARIDRRPQVRRLAVRGLGVAGGGLLLSAAGVVLFPGLAMLLGAGAGVAGLVCFVALILANARSAPRLTSGKVAIEGRTLRLPDHRRAIDLGDVVQGWREDPDLFHLALKRGEVLVVKAGSLAGGDRLLRAAGVTAAQRILRVPLVSAASRIPGGSVVGGILLTIFGGALLSATVALALTMKEMIRTDGSAALNVFPFSVTFAALLAFAVYAIVSALQRREVVVGTDGIAYKKTFRTEFIPYGSLASVEQDTRGVRLVLKGGRRILLPTRSAADRPLPLAHRAAAPKTPAEAQRRVLVERIRAAMEAGGGTGMAQVTMDRLDRQGRSREAWREDLGKLLGADGDYRSALVSPEDLGGLIEDPSAPAERRVAAAVALAARAGDEARRRVRIAVQACADEDLRGALEAAAEGEIEEAALGRAMARRV